MSDSFNSSDRSRLICILLWFLCFFGFCGVHRIYAGKVFTGILQFITLGLCGIWQLIDLICILLGCFEDSEGRPIR